jgi:hypothetical protein
MGYILTLGNQSVCSYTVLPLGGIAASADDGNYFNKMKYFIL